MDLEELFSTRDHVMLEPDAANSETQLILNWSFEGINATDARVDIEVRYGRAFE